MGVDPRTGNAPRTAKRREALENLFKEQPPRLEREFDILIDVYQEAFGAEAADGFRKAIRAWHAGVEVITEAPPISPALAASIDGGVFGVEEHGTNVNPNLEEVQEIVERVADALIDEPPGPGRDAWLKKYAEDFSVKAAGELDRWSRLKPVAEDTRSADYDPGHPWHYCERGDAAEPLPLDAIPARPITIEQFGVKWPKAPAKRRALMQQMLAGQRTQLAEDEKRYKQLTDEGADALSQYDREIAHGGDNELAWASAVAMKFNHVAGGRGRVQRLAEQLGLTNKGHGKNPSPGAISDRDDL